MAEGSNEWGALVQVFGVEVNARVVHLQRREVQEEPDCCGHLRQGGAFNVMNAPRRHLGPVGI